MEQIHSRTFFISANESNPEGELALPILVSNIIEIATEHANILGIGNPTMQHLNAGWVLSRLTIEIFRYPAVNTSYRISTWVESWNKHFSMRDFKIESEEGEILGYARSVWMVLDTRTHENFGLSHLQLPAEAVCDEPCPIERQLKHSDIASFASDPSTIPTRALHADKPDVSYTFCYSDIDFYRHVNTVRYVNLLCNQYSLEDFDSYYVKRLEMSFLHEGNYGMKVSVRRKSDPTISTTSFAVVDEKENRTILFARIRLEPRS